MKAYREEDFHERRPVWIALSDLYIDTELQDFEIRHIAKVIHESPYSVEEARAINKLEVFPVVHGNLLSVAGVWTGFKEEWLVNKVLRHVKSNSYLKKSLTRLTYLLLSKMIKEDWLRIVSEMDRLSKSV